MTDKETDIHVVRIFPARITSLFVGVAIPLLAGCTGSSTTVRGAMSQPAPSAQRANPASQHCVKEGGALSIEPNPGGGQYGVCNFPDNRQCEEWALFRGQCQSGGIKVTGYVTQGARYCAITGGRYTVVAQSGAADERGSCALPNGKTCEAGMYYRGECGRD